MSSQRNIIIDTDPGQDDALAILLALASPELNVLGIVAVAGNVPLALTSRNIRVICELSSKTNIPLFEGASQPLERELVTAEYVHGKTGLNGAELPEPSITIEKQHGADFIAQTILAMPAKTITLCMLGPLTNAAIALQQHPEIADRLDEIVLMGGGCFEGGNVTPAAEFNIFVDPEAADIVMKSGAKITILPLDCTHKTLTSASRTETFRAMGTKVGDACVGWLEFYERFDEDKYGTDGGPLHDPNVIAWLLKPEMYQGRQINVSIETESELTRGMTVADWWGVTGRKPNAFYIRDVDDDAFFELLTLRIASL